MRTYADADGLIPPSDPLKLSCVLFYQKAVVKIVPLPLLTARKVPQQGTWSTPTWQPLPWTLHWLTEALPESRGEDGAATPLQVWLCSPWACCKYGGLWVIIDCFCKHPLASKLVRELVTSYLLCQVLLMQSMEPLITSLFSLKIIRKVEKGAF
jgi:hypothetical protein